MIAVPILSIYGYGGEILRPSYTDDAYDSLVN